MIPKPLYIPAWRLESFDRSHAFCATPATLLDCFFCVFFRICSCQLGPCSHSFPRYNLIRVSIHSICMELLWLGRKKKPVKTRAKGKNPKPWHRLTRSTTTVEEQGLSNEPQLLLQLKQSIFSLKVWHVFHKRKQPLNRTLGNTSNDRSKIRAYYWFKIENTYLHISRWSQTKFQAQQKLGPFHKLPYKANNFRRF